VINQTREENAAENTLTLARLLDPQTLADPYPLFKRLRSADPVYWDIYLHAWVATGYEEVVQVLKNLSARRVPTPEEIRQLGLADFSPVAAVMVKQMLFLDPPDHTRIRKLAAAAFAPPRIEALEPKIRSIASGLLKPAFDKGNFDVIAEFAEPLPAIVTALMLGLPESDHRQLKTWSAEFAGLLGNFHNNTDRSTEILPTLYNLIAYFREQMRVLSRHPNDGLVYSFMTAEVDGERFSEDEIIFNSILTLVGSQETTTNLIGNGLLALIRNPAEFQRLRREPSLLPLAVEELLRYDCPSQHTARVASEKTKLGNKLIEAGQHVIAVMAAGNRDPAVFENPDHLDLGRENNRHLAFGWAAHYCFGAALARLEGQIAFGLFRELPEPSLASRELTWRNNLGLRGLEQLVVRFDN
jgi:cytochrome P450